MPAKKNRVREEDLQGTALLKACNRRIRAAMSIWDAHRNAACRRERERALRLYERLDENQRRQVPEQLRVWLRYRSAKYFGEQHDAPGTKTGGPKRRGRGPGGGTWPTAREDKPSVEDDHEWP